MDIEIPDNEDAACDMDQLESYFARRGQYEEAAMVNGAARRLRADDDEKRRMDAENHELRADLDWAAINAARWMVGEGLSNTLEWDDIAQPQEAEFDGTPADLLRVIRAARKGTR